MAEFFPLYDLKARPLFMARGDVSPYVGRLIGGDTLRAKLKRGMIAWQLASPIKRRLPVFWRPIAERIQNATRDEESDILLMDTSWYKSTKAVGFVKARDVTYFIKIHNDSEECFFEEGQTRFVREYFGGAFVTASIIENAGNILFFQNIGKKRDTNKDDHVEQKLLDITASFLRNHRLEKTISEMVPLDMFVMLHVSEYADLGIKIRKWVEARQDDMVQSIPVHGDATPWNMFITEGEKIALLDYEKAGWHVAYYDVFHYLLQPQALAQRTHAVKRTLYKKEWFLTDGMKPYLILYLIDQLYHDLNEHLKKGFMHAQLLGMIKTKIKWLEELLHDEQSS